MASLRALGKSRGYLEDWLPELDGKRRDLVQKAIDDIDKISVLIEVAGDDPDAEISLPLEWSTALGNQVRSMRQERELTQEGLAKAAATTQSVISRLESGDRKKVPVGQLRMIAEALGTLPSHLPLLATKTDGADAFANATDKFTSGLFPEVAE